MNLPTTTKLALQIKCDCGSGYLQIPALSSSIFISLQIAQLNPRNAINKTFANFREVALSGQGILLLAILAVIAWTAWKKKIQ